MQPLAPPPPYTPPPIKQKKPSPLYQIVLSKQVKNQHNASPESLLHESKLRSREQQPPILRRPRRTNPVVWCGAIVCLLFSLLLIFFGISTLIIFVAVKPRNPVFDTPAANLNAIYFASPELLNADMVFLANFSNPNRKLKVRFEHLQIELYFSENLIASQVLQPFSQNPGQAQFMSVHLVSSLVHLPLNLALELEKQEQRNRVVYAMKGSFRVKATLGLVRYSYSLRSECRLEMTSPPNGVLLSRSCRTKR